MVKYVNDELSYRKWIRGDEVMNVKNDIIEMLLDNEKCRLYNLKEEQKKIGEGKLHLIRAEKGQFFREYCDHKQRGITRNQHRVYQLARKDIITEQIRTCEAAVLNMERISSELDNINRNSREDVYIEKYCTLDKHRLIYSSDELKWYENRMSQNPFKRENLIYGTSDGIMMRSKSERYIGDFLSRYGVLYMYEPELKIEGKSMYPDFMILRPDGKSVIWEHFGLVNNIDYFNKAMMKLHEYRKLGYMPNLNLVYTYEEDLHNTKTLKNIVNRYVFL